MNTPAGTHTALRAATLNGQAALVDKLLKAGADASICSNNARTPLMGACYPRHGVPEASTKACVELLLNDANGRRTLGWQNDDGDTALHLACFGAPAAALVLAKAGAPRDVLNNRSETPDDLARRAGLRLDPGVPLPLPLPPAPAPAPVFGPRGNHLLDRAPWCRCHTGTPSPRHRRDSTHRSIATQPPQAPPPPPPRPKPPQQKAKPPVRVPTGGKYAKPRGRAPLNAEGKPASWDPDLGEWVGAYSGVSCNLQPSHLCVLRQASTPTRTTTVLPVSLSPSDNNAYTQASSRRRSRTASPNHEEGLLWARRGTTTRASGSAVRASPSLRGRRSRRRRRKMWFL